jgi:hypothetical protein
MPELATKEIKSNYNKNTKVRSKINEFWNYCEVNKYIPDVEMLCYFLDIDRSTLWKWETSTDNEILSNIIKKVKNRIFANKKQLAMCGKMNATIFIFDAKNNHGYVDKIDHEHNSNTNITVSFNIPKVDTNIPVKTIEGQVIESTPIKQLK